MICSKIPKILHGSESDCNRVYVDLLHSSKKKFMNFINSTIDTIFLCKITMRIISRLGIKVENENKCSLYYALINNKVIDKKLFDTLQAESDKINYNKPWIVANLTPKQIKYAVYDVMFLYDLLRNMSTRIQPVNNANIDVISCVNRMYRFHMINKLNLSKISEKCKQMFDQIKVSESLSRDDVYQIDQKIMELKFNTVRFDGKEIDIYIDDLISIDVIRKSNISYLRIYILNNSSDTQILDKMLKSSDIFNSMKGHHTIMHLIDIVRKNRRYNKIECNEN